jgi:DNA-binding transcriptional ArsR family regulator
MGEHILRVLSHATRLQMLSLMAGRAWSAAELARELGVKHAAASYHLRRLVASGLVVLAEVRENRGAQERRYRQPPPGEDVVGDRPAEPEQWESLVATIASELERRALRTAPRPKWFYDAELWVAPETLDEVRSAMNAALRRLQARAGEPDDERTARVSATALLFELDTRPDPRP